MKSIQLNKCSPDELKELLGSEEEIVFRAEYAFDIHLLNEINKHPEKNIRFHLCIGEDVPVELLKLVPNIRRLIISPDYNYKLEKTDALTGLNNLTSLKLGKIGRAHV